MACDCQKRIKDMLVEHHGKGKQDFQLELGGYVILFTQTGPLKSKAALPVTMEYKAKRKSGQVYVKKEKTNMIATYCPFCGVKYDEDKNE